MFTLEFVQNEKIIRWGGNLWEAWSGPEVNEATFKNSAMAEFKKYGKHLRTNVRKQNGSTVVNLTSGGQHALVVTMTTSNYGWYFAVVNPPAKWDHTIQVG